MFLKDFQQVLKDYPEWAWTGEDKKSGQDRMEVEEPLLDMYGLTNWMNPKYVNQPNANPADKCTPTVGQYTTMFFRGAYRI